MSTSPAIGTREFYQSRKVSTNPRKRELIDLLYIRTLKAVAASLSEDKQPPISALENPRELNRNYPEFMDAYFRNKEIGAKIEKVFKNIGKTNNETLMGDEAKNEVFLLLEQLPGAIWGNPGFLDGTDYDEHTKEMGKEWAQSFVEGWINDFKSRGYLDGEYTDDKDGVAEERKEWPMQRKYELLYTISQLSGDKKDAIIASICANLPSYPGAEFTWDNMQDIYDEAMENVTQY